MEDVLNSLTGDLRVALLVLGGIVLLLIVLWEILQRGRAARADASRLRGPLGQAADADDEVLSRADPLTRNDLVDRGESFAPTRTEPTLTLPEISATRDRLVEPRLVDLDTARVEPGLGTDIPVMEDAAAAGPAPASPDPATPATTSPVTEEDERVIVGLRVVARGAERFSGASLRQALLGEGFVHGDMSIFHRQLADGRTLMSAASLTKPGNFDLATIDSSRFLGINLFAVLPGPMPGRDTVDKLLLTGHTLAQRLRGDLLDSKGQPLTEARLAEMRREAAAAAN
ncbi:MAG: cell division protein ZipA C-terminal FtsZ-binding domain-containing protein [Steroidobacteraceae bacterium]|jgi:cell division protein ZipA